MPPGIDHIVGMLGFCYLIGSPREKSCNSGKLMVIFFGLVKEEEDEKKLKYCGKITMEVHLADTIFNC